MSAKVVAHPSAGLAAPTWPGHVAIDKTGARIALDLLIEMESIDDDGTNLSDLAALENWPRQGKPYRNTVAEYAAKAQSAGPEALAAFYAILGDYLGSTAGGGSIPIVDRCYDRYCGEEDSQA